MRSCYQQLNLWKNGFYGQIFRKPGVLTIRNRCCQNQNIPRQLQNYTGKYSDLFQQNDYFCPICAYPSDLNMTTTKFYRYIIPILLTLIGMTARSFAQSAPGGEVTFTIVGRIALPADRELSEKETEALFSGASRYLSSADLTYGSIDSTVLYRTDVLKGVGFDVLGYGDQCQFETREIGGRRIKIGFCSFSEMPTGLGGDEEIVSELIRGYVRSVKDSCDILVVSFQSPYDGPNSEHFSIDEDLFPRVCIDAGADMVIGQGGGVARGVELYHHRLIAYSLGKFCTPFGSNVKSYSGLAPVLQVTVTDQGRFVDGKIISMLQNPGKGPSADPKDKAATMIRYVSETDFPDSGIDVGPDGILAIKTATVRDNFVDSLLAYGTRYLGRPYSLGKTGPSAFDCSGLVYSLYSKFGIKLGRTAREQYRNGRPVNRMELRKGDLIFFNTQRNVYPGHVAIVYEVMPDGNFRFLHSCSSKGVTIQTFNGSYYYFSRYVGARRVVEDER